jgi:rod shape determining protein RodA
MFKLQFDSLITIPSTLLIVLGLTILRSIVPDLFTSQLIFAIFAVLIFIFASSIDSEVFFSLGSLGYFFFLILTMSLPVLGFLSRGATRWIQLGSFTLQPSELLKPFLLLALAHVATFHSTRQNLLLMLLGVIPILIVFIQPDLGTSLVLFVGWCGFVLTRFRLKSLISLFLIFMISAFPIYQFILKDYQRQRITTFINPYTDPLGRGYHIIQSMIAVGSGQLFGRGLGHGTQTQLRFLPEHHTDFIFSSISEELGFVGSSITILLYFVLLFRIYRISQETTDTKSALFCLSALGMLGFQIFVNIGMNIGLSPITGITLPMLSYGGSSLLSTSIILAVINSISAKIHGQKYWSIR